MTRIIRVTFLRMTKLTWRRAAAAAGVLALAGTQSCAGPSRWEQAKPVDVGTQDGPNLAAVTESITTPVLGVYVVTAQGVDGYCNATLFANNHIGAIQSCIDQASADGGGVVLLRAGVYSTGSWGFLHVKTGVTLKGDGHGAAQLKPNSGFNIINAVDDNSAVEDLYFDTTNVNGAIQLGSGTSKTRIRIDDNTFNVVANNSNLRQGIYALTAPSISDVMIRRNVFTSTFLPLAFEAVYLQIANGAAGPFKNVRVEDNIISLASSTDRPIFLVGTGNPFNTDGSVAVSGNVLTTASFPSLQAINLTGIRAQVTNNSVTGWSTPLEVSPVGGTTACGVLVSGNNFDHAPSIDAPCPSVVVGNSTNGSQNIANGAGIGRAGVLVRAHLGATQNFTPGAGAQIVFGAEDLDYGSNFNPATGTFTAPATGRYRVHACARFNTTNFGPTDTADLKIVSGTSGTQTLNKVAPGGSSSSFTSCVDDIVFANSTETLQVWVDATGTGTRSINGTGVYSTFVNIEQVSD
jgi:hypothetical protein